MQIICITRVHPLHYPNARKRLAIFIVDKLKKQYWRKNCDGHATVFQVNPSFHIKES